MSFQPYIKYILLKHKEFYYNQIVMITPNKIKINYSVQFTTWAIFKFLIIVRYIYLYLVVQIKI